MALLLKGAMLGDMSCRQKHLANIKQINKYVNKLSMDEGSWELITVESTHKLSFFLSFYESSVLSML